MHPVGSLLSLPTDEVQTCPSPLSDEDLIVVIHEMGAVLRKWLYAARFTLATPFTIFLRLLHRAAVVYCDRMTQALLIFKEGERLLDVLVDLCGVVLLPAGRILREGVLIESFLDFIQLLCVSAALKDELGQVLLPVLVKFLCYVVDGEDDYRQPRACASLMITLLRGSKINKERLGTECTCIAAALERSGDIFFQMQCAEIIFRLYTYDRTVLASCAFPDLLKKSIKKLPNDSSLLTCIQSMLESYNVERGISYMLQFSVLLVEVGDMEVCGHTKLFFSPLILVIMIPGCNGDNITIPYEHVRSVKLSRERKLGLRLNAIPAKLSNIMACDGVRDTLSISLTHSTYNAIRSSNVHGWISERKRRVPSSPLGSELEVTAGTVASGEHEDVSLHSCQINGLTQNLGAVRLEGSCSYERGSDCRQQAPTMPCGDPRSAQQHQQCKPESPIRGKPVPEVAEKRENTSSYTTGEALRQLHKAASQKVARMRYDSRDALQSAVDFMRGELDNMHRVNASERDTFEASVREDLATVRDAEAKVKTRATECVQSLNQELTEIQGIGDSLKREVDSLRGYLEETLQRSEQAEVCALVQLKSLVDTEIKAMEDKLFSVVSATSSKHTVR
ncbi:hypothetical protein TRVL_04750 [Trypanosoma vivax]|nr:hypothetical protein TRVL_04750 [Trypanosoma vivax]